MALKHYTTISLSNEKEDIKSQYILKEDRRS